tara:strand:- start:5938 stop:6489 length:552 start_codon:yes stop_codon:yes gene_type:complete
MFNKIIEENMRRYQQNSLIVGDRVKFIDTFLSHDWTKSQPVLKVERLKALIEGGHNIRVTAVKTVRPQTAESGHFEIIDEIYYDVVEEMAPGRYGHLFTIPQGLVEHLDDYPNLAGETPSDLVQKDPTNIKPQELISGDQSDLHPNKQTHGHGGDLENPTSNTNIGGKEPKPGESYTKKYING